MKKYLFLAVALLGLASCAKDDIANGNNPIHNGEIEESYIAINLSASDVTRAEGDPEFVDGEEAERAVSHADFFFFDEAGEPFNVNVSGTNDDQWTEGTGSGRNHLRVTTINWTKDEDSDDISDTAKPVMLLKTYKGEYPSQIVAVLNWSPDNKPYSLSDLHDAVNVQSSFNSTNYFVMSNAVYAQNGNAVYATPLTIDNIKKSEDEAKTAPVTIYVERVAAKVTVKSIDSSNNKFDVGQDFTYTTTDGENTTTTTTDVYAHIAGWELYNDNPQSKLLKQIDATWSNDVLGFTWNDAPWYRCFWANSLAMPNDTVSNTTPFVNGDHTYIGENTTANNTKVIIKAVLKNADGTQVAEIALWNNVQYVGELALRTAVANTLVNTYYSLTIVDEKNVYTGLKPEDLQCVAGGTAVAPEGVAANEVYFQLSNEGAAKNWYKLVNGEYIPVANDITKDTNSIEATNKALKSIPSAVLYKDCETFYYVDIRHLAKDLNKTGSYGVVRNHIYDIVIKSIKGYGSPVYKGIQLVEYPTTPEQNSFVSAQINILSWRLVSQEVDIQPNN